MTEQNFQLPICAYNKNTVPWSTLLYALENIETTWIDMDSVNNSVMYTAGHKSNSAFNLNKKKNESGIWWSSYFLHLRSKF